MHRDARSWPRCLFLVLVLCAGQSADTAVASAAGENCVPPEDVTDPNQPPGEVCAIDEDVGPVPADDVPPIMIAPLEPPFVIVQLGPAGPELIIVEPEIAP